MFKLLEDNENINDLIVYLEYVISNLRKSGKLKENPEIVEKLEDFFEDKILPFTRHHYLMGVETNKKFEEDLMEQINKLIGVLSHIK